MEKLDCEPRQSASRVWVSDHCPPLLSGLCLPPLRASSELMWGSRRASRRERCWSWHLMDKEKPTGQKRGRVRSVPGRGSSMSRAGGRILALGTGRPWITKSPWRAWGALKEMRWAKARPGWGAHGWTRLCGIPRCGLGCSCKRGVVDMRVSTGEPVRGRARGQLWGLGSPTAQ